MKEQLHDLIIVGSGPVGLEMGLAAAEAALQDPDYVRESRTLNERGMTQITAGLQEMELEYIPSLGNFVALAVPGANGSPGASEVYEDLLRLGVIVRPIAEYGLPRHLRVSIGLPEENARFLQALARVLG